jgi:uncharacterized protein YjbJ (UPF0337 family)
MADKTDKLEGKAKEVAGRLTGKDDLESEGRTERVTEETKENLEEAGDKVKGTARGLKEKFTDE